MKNIKTFSFILIWYIIPFLYLLTVKEIFLPFTLLCIVIFLFFFLIGQLISSKIKVHDEVNIPHLKAYKFLQFFTILLQLISLVRLFVIGKFDLFSHRNLVFGDPLYLFGSSYLFTLYLNFLIPLNIIYSIYFASLKSKHLNFSLGVSLIIILVDSILMLGRFQLIYILFMLFLRLGQNKKNLIRISIVTFLVFILSICVIYFRQFFSDSSLDHTIAFLNFDFFDKSIISYQFYGYVVLEKYISSTSLFGNIFSLNCLNFPIYLSSILFSKLGIMINNPWETINLVISEGIYIESIDTYVNAFTTNFLPIYLDFGIVGISFFGISFGMIFGLDGKSPFLSFIKNLALFILIFGLYQPIIIYLYGFVLFICVIYFVSNKKFYYNHLHSFK